MIRRVLLDRKRRTLRDNPESRCMVRRVRGRQMLCDTDLERTVIGRRGDGNYGRKHVDANNGN